jgi:hypothetical protein
MGTAPADTPGQRGLTSGLGVARPAGKSRGSGGGCTGLQERQRRSPRRPGVVEAVKVLSSSGVLPDGGAPVIYDILRWVLQQGVEEGEVRDYPTEGKGSTRVELTAGREMVARRREDDAGNGGPVARRGHEAEERMGGVRSHGQRRTKMEEGGKGGAAATSTLLSEHDGVGGGRSAGGTTR